MVSQSYTANVWEEHVIRGNSALLKCQVPAFVADFVSISAWLADNETIEIGGAGGAGAFGRFRLRRREESMEKGAGDVENESEGGLS